MKRYFEIIGEKQTLEIDVEKGSDAEKATPKEIGNHFTKELRELCSTEYKKLTMQFTQ